MPAPTGPGHEDRAVGLGDQPVELLGLLGGHAQVRRSRWTSVHHLVDPDDDLLAERGREGGQRGGRGGRLWCWIVIRPSCECRRSTMFRFEMTLSRLITGVAMAGSRTRMSWSWPSIR